MVPEAWMRSLLSRVAVLCGAMSAMSLLAAGLGAGWRWWALTRDPHGGGEMGRSILGIVEFAAKGALALAGGLALVAAVFAIASRVARPGRTTR
jgi:hypothetical protein